MSSYAASSDERTQRLRSLKGRAGRQERGTFWETTGGKGRGKSIVFFGDYKDMPEYKKALRQERKRKHEAEIDSMQLLQSYDEFEIDEEKKIIPKYEKGRDVESYFDDSLEESILRNIEEEEEVLGRSGPPAPLSPPQRTYSFSSIYHEPSSDSSFFQNIPQDWFSPWFHPKPRYSYSAKWAREKQMRTRKWYRDKEKMKRKDNETYSDYKERIHEMLNSRYKKRINLGLATIDPTHLEFTAAQKVRREPEKLSGNRYIDYTGIIRSLPMNEEEAKIVWDEEIRKANK